MSSFEVIGRPLKRREDRRFLKGLGRYLDDVVVANALHVAFVRSPHAHARILSVDTEAARALPGIVAVVTGHDLVEATRPLRMAPAIEGLQPTEVATLPLDCVRFAGDLVACVVARSRYLAEDGCEAVAVEYEPLDAVTDMEAALAPGAPLVDPALASNLVSHQSFATGDPARRFAEAARVVEATFRQGRQTHAPMEGRGCLAVWDEGTRHLTVQIGTQAPHPLRTQLAARLGLAETAVSVISPDVGGAFGQKIALYREELTVAALAIRLRRPVRWREDRMENLLAASHAREDTARTRAAVDAEGRILALHLDLVEDFGAYCFFPANYLARVVAMILPGPYRIQDYSFDVRIALTNKCGSGPMRAPMAITTWVMEGTIEAVARELGLDPVAVRRTNMLTAAELPYRTATGEVLADVTPRETLDAVVAQADREAFRARQAADRAGGILRGQGIACVIEPTTYGSAFYKAAGIPGSGHESGWVRVEPTGAVNASVGLMGAGQGYETAFAQAVADGLGVEPETVRILLGHTDIAPYGMGSRGARGGTAGGGVLYLAARSLRGKVLAIAAARLGLNTGDDLALRGGRIERRIAERWEPTGLTLADVARIAYLDPLQLPAGMEPGLEAVKAYDPPAMTYSNAAHLCEVAIEGRTGRIHVTRYLVAEDCGTVLNPIVVAGQQRGAIAMGLGGALLEEVVYDAEGQNLSATLADYLLPTAGDVPTIEILPMHTPSRSTPAGIKGMSEGGVMGAVAAVSNAVNDALAHLGVVAEAQPFRPDVIRALLREATPGADATG